MHDEGGPKAGMRPLVWLHVAMATLVGLQLAGLRALLRTHSLPLPSLFRRMLRRETVSREVGGSGLCP